MALNNKKNKPDFIVAGAAKCGTTTLFDFLDGHPQIYMSPLKEPHFFCTDIRFSNFSNEYLHSFRSRNFNLERYLQGDMKEKIYDWYIEDESEYLQLFRKRTDEKAAGEISNGYLFSKTAAVNILKSIPDAKIIIILRDPSSRAYSHYMANLRDGRTSNEFITELNSDLNKEKKGWCISHNYIEMGLYYEQVKRFTDIFPSENIRIYLFDDLKHNPQALCEDLFKFIDVDPDIQINYQKKRNEARMPKSANLNRLVTQTGLKRKLFRLFPESRREQIKSMFYRKEPAAKLTAEHRRILIPYFRDDILKLQNLINRDLKNWLNLYE